LSTHTFLNIIKAENTIVYSPIFLGAAKMFLSIFFGIILPFIGTTLGSAGVFFVSRKHSFYRTSTLSGFAAGVMVAASVWSLIIPAVEMSAKLGLFAFLPMLCGFWAGVAFLLFTEALLSSKNKQKEGKDTLFLLAVVLHNIPEGMAVGVAFALAVSQGSDAALVSAFMLAVGMTIQNIPEGAIISLPLADKGYSKSKSFIFGSLSGIAEPVFALISLMFSSVSAMILPYLLGFAAGAMIYVSANELIPEAKGTKGCIFFLLGFSVMMVLDVALG